MFDLLLGAPGETEETVEVTIERAKGLAVPLVEMALGVRVYPNTPLGDMALSGHLQEGLYPPQWLPLIEPVFYLSPQLGSNPFDFVRGLISGDERFLLLSLPGEEGAYNYADDEALCQAISKGARGAYWDILRKSAP